jgi:hypothetical protein
MDLDNKPLEIQLDNHQAFERIRANTEKTIRRLRAEAVANNNNNNNTDNSYISKAAEAYNVPCNDSDSKTEISRPRGFIGILAKDVEP